MNKNVLNQIESFEQHNRSNFIESDPIGYMDISNTI